MRRWTLGTAVLSLIMFGAAPAAAQVPVTFGPMGGVSFMTLSGEDADDFGEFGGDVDKGNRVGFAAGAFARFDMGGWAIEPQLLYIQKGAKYTASQDGVEGSANIELSYIQIPVLLKWQFGTPAAKVRPSIFAGPAIGFKSSCSVSVEIDGEDFGSEDCGDDAIKGTDFTGVFGAGLDFGRWALQGRYDMGFSSIAEGDADVKNSGFLVTLGYGF